MRLRTIGDDHPQTIQNVANLGECLFHVGDVRQGIRLMMEAHASSRRIFGEAHVTTIYRADRVAQAQRGVGEGTHARGVLTGLASDFLARYREMLNGDKACVLGYDQTHRRFCVNYCNGLAAVKVPLENCVLYSGTAVIVEGLIAAPEWNGTRGLIEKFDDQKGRYLVVVPGRKKPLGLKPSCCQLEKVEVYTGEIQREIPDGFSHDWGDNEEKRAQVAERVRLAIAMRDSQPEPELEADRDKSQQV